MSISRRRFLSTGAASAAVISGSANIPSLLLEAAAAPAGDAAQDNVLIVLQLSGGNDGLNTVVPFADDIYGSNRFQTRLAKSAVHKINDYVGFHPAMKEMHRLYQDGGLSIVQGVGYENPNRSHFESMDIWHTAQTDVPTRQIRKLGWIGNYLDATRGSENAQRQQDVPGVHLGSDVQPLALAGLHVQVPSIGSFDEFQFDADAPPQVARLREHFIKTAASQHSDLVAHVREAARTALDSSRRVREAVASDKDAGDYPTTDLGQKLHGIARLIKAGLATRIYYVTLDGFDTHSLQAETHASLLRELSGAVAALQDDLQGAGQSDRVLLMCFSEFGRRVKENASRGTDHGAAAPMFLAGGALRGGLVGDHPRMDDLKDGDLKFHTDFRSIYATVLEKWLKVASAPILGADYPLLDVFA